MFVIKNIKDMINPSKLLCINTRNGIELIDLTQVVYLRADGNYTMFVTADGKSRTHLSTLARFEEEINALSAKSAGGVNRFAFFRVSRSYLVNTDYVSGVSLSTQSVSFFTDSVKPLVISKKLLKVLQSYIYDCYCKRLGREE